MLSPHFGGVKPCPTLEGQAGAGPCILSPSLLWGWATPPFPHAGQGIGARLHSLPSQPQQNRLGPGPPTPLQGQVGAEPCTLPPSPPTTEPGNTPSLPSPPLCVAESATGALGARAGPPARSSPKMNLAHCPSGLQAKKVGHHWSRTYNRQVFLGVNHHTVELSLLTSTPEIYLLSFVILPTSVPLSLFLLICPSERPYSIITCPVERCVHSCFSGLAITPWKENSVTAECSLGHFKPPCSLCWYIL